MSPHHRHPLISAAVLAASLSLLSSPTPAATKTWTNPAGGSWADPANWSAPVPPAYPDIAVFDLNAAPAGYTVTLPSSLSHIGTLAVSLDPSYSPAAGDAFDLLDVYARDGSSTFDTLSLPPSPAAAAPTNPAISASCSPSKPWDSNP